MKFKVGRYYQRHVDFSFSITTLYVIKVTEITDIYKKGVLYKYKLIRGPVYDTINWFYENSEFAKGWEEINILKAKLLYETKG